MAVGYVYVLANGATPGVARIGKGPTAPAHMAEGLTQPSATPSPSLVAYEQFCADADAVHAAVMSSLPDADLIRRGDSTLLVRIAVSDAVKLVVRAINTESKNADDLELELRWDSPSQPWHELMQ